MTLYMPLYNMSLVRIRNESVKEIKEIILNLIWKI